MPVQVQVDIHIDARSVRTASRVVPEQLFRRFAHVVFAEVVLLFMTLQEGVAVYVMPPVTLLLILIVCNANRADTFECTSEFTEIGTKWPGMRWRRLRLATKDVQEMQFSTLRLTAYGVVNGIVFRVAGTRYQACSRVTPQDAVKIFAGCKSLGAGVQDDPGLPMLEEIYTTNQEMFGRFSALESRVDPMRPLFHNLHPIIRNDLSHPQSRVLVCTLLSQCHVERRKKPRGVRQVRQHERTRT